MAQLNIHRLRTCYHLPGGDGDMRARLDRVRDTVLREGLEAALDRLGVGSEGQVFIRRVGAPCEPLLSDSDAALGIDWSLALAQAIGAALQRGDSDNVVLVSDASARLDRFRARSESW